VLSDPSARNGWNDGRGVSDKTKSFKACCAGGRTVPSHILSRAARHSNLGTQLQVKVRHHTPETLWNQIHVHRASR
jgi:hypothetical protein